MAFSEDRLSTLPDIREWLPPDDRERLTFLVDYEAGPVAIADTSQGLFYQNWTLQYDTNTGNFVLTPETTGSPVNAYNHADVTQCTLAFDQNGRPSFAFTADGIPKLYWYDTLAANFVTTTLDLDVVFPTVGLDDKRTTQTNSSDIILWYTRPQPDGSYNLYFRKQRERFETERLLRTSVNPFMYKAGMHFGLRVQLALLGILVTTTPPEIPDGPVMPQANLDFELGDVYWDKTGNFTIVDIDPFMGTYSAILTAGIYSSMLNSIETIITPGGPIVVSGVAKGTEATTVKLGIKFYNPAHALLATDIAIKNITTGWTQLIHGTTAPEQAVYARIFVESNTTLGTVSFDNFGFFSAIDLSSIYEIELGATVTYEVELDVLEHYEVEL